MKHRIQYNVANPFALTIMFFCLSCTLSSQQNSPRSKTISPISVEEGKLFDLLNQARRENKLPMLRWNEQLAVAARRHAVLMSEHNEVSHRFAGENDLPERAANADVHFSIIAENVGLGPTPEKIHDLLMHSSGHRANILDPASNEVGIAIVRGKDGLYAVQDFAHTVENLDASQQTALVDSLLQKEGFTIVNSDHNAAMFCENDNGAALPGVTEIFHYETADLSTLPDALKNKDLKKRFRNAAVASCKVGPQPESTKGFTRYRMVVLLY